MKKTFAYLFAAGFITLVTACHKEPVWKVEGTVEGADNKTLILEATNNGTWYVVDSVKTNDKGEFTIERPATTKPEIFRLSMDGHLTYLPIDSAQTLTFKSKADSFDKNYSVSGSPAADMFTLANRLVWKSEMTDETRDSLKRELSKMILQQPLSDFSYFILVSNTEGGRPLFNPADKTDKRIIRGVANAYYQAKKDDPRTLQLVALTEGTQRAAAIINSGEKVDSLYLSELSFPEIELMDKDGKMRSLSSITGKAPVVLNFTRYSGDYSPAVNLALGTVMEKYANRGLQVYQVDFDADEYFWLQNARTLPWISVYNSASTGNRYLESYRIEKLPTSFFIDSNGELVERIDDPADIESVVDKYLQ